MRTKDDDERGGTANTDQDWGDEVPASRSTAAAAALPKPALGNRAAIRQQRQWASRAESRARGGDVTLREHGGCAAAAKRAGRPAERPEPAIRPRKSVRSSCPSVQEKACRSLWAVGLSDGWPAYGPAQPEAAREGGEGATIRRRRQPHLLLQLASTKPNTRCTPPAAWGGLYTHNARASAHTSFSPHPPEGPPRGLRL